MVTRKLFRIMFGTYNFVWADYENGKYVGYTVMGESKSYRPESPDEYSEAWTKDHKDYLEISNNNLISILYGLE